MLDDPLLQLACGQSPVEDAKLQSRGLMLRPATVAQLIC